MGEEVGEGKEEYQRLNSGGGGGEGGRMPVFQYQGPAAHLHHSLHLHRWLQEKGKKGAAAGPAPQLEH